MKKLKYTLLALALGICSASASTITYNYEGGTIYYPSWNPWMPANGRFQGTVSINPEGLEEQYPYTGNQFLGQGFWSINMGDFVFYGSGCLIHPGDGTDADEIFFWNPVPEVINLGPRYQLWLDDLYMWWTDPTGTFFDNHTLADMDPKFFPIQRVGLFGGGFDRLNPDAFVGVGFSADIKPNLEFVQVPDGGSTALLLTMGMATMLIFGMKEPE